jgi:ankyrin repeat protein
MDYNISEQIIQNYYDKIKDENSISNLKLQIKHLIRLCSVNKTNHNYCIDNNIYNDIKEIYNIKLLINNGDMDRNLNLTNQLEWITKEYNLTSLMLSIFTDNKYLFDLIIKYSKPSDINVQVENNWQGEDGKTALMYAAENKSANNLYYVKKLIVNGVIIDIIDEEGNEALDFANDNSNNNIVQYLTSLL